MLKEQVAVILLDVIDKVEKQKIIASLANCELEAEPILNLFKAEVDKLTVIDDEGIRNALYKTEWKVIVHKREQSPRTNMNVYALYVNDEMFGYVTDKPEDKDWFSIYKGNREYASSTIAKHNLGEAKQALLNMAMADMSLPENRGKVKEAQLQHTKKQLLDLMDS